MIETSFSLGHKFAPGGNWGMENLIELNRKRVFSERDLEDLLPLVIRITKQYSTQVQGLITRAEAARGKNDQVASQIEAEINNTVELWQAKMEKLGAQTKGLWIADFDSGDGYFCWKFPEEKIEYWHRYSDGFSGRVKLSEKRSRHLSSVEKSREISPPHN